MAGGKQRLHCESSSNVGREEEWQGSGSGKMILLNLVLSEKGRGSSDPKFSCTKGN